MALKDDIAEGTDYYRKSYMKQKSTYDKLMKGKSFSKMSFEALMLRHSEHIKPYLSDNYPEMEDDGWINPDPDWIGCMDIKALNFNPFATVHDPDTCIYPDEWIPKPIPGCMDPNAVNYNPSAQKSDNSCVYWTHWTPPPLGPNPIPPPGPIPPPWHWVYGCMDKKAKNYNPKANRQPSGACQYEEDEPPGMRVLNCWPLDCYCPGLAKSIEVVCTEPPTLIDFWQNDLMQDSSIKGFRDGMTAREDWGQCEGKTDAQVSAECRAKTPDMWVIDTSAFPLKARIYAPMKAWHHVTFLAHFPQWKQRDAWYEQLRKLKSGLLTIDPLTGTLIKSKAKIQLKCKTAPGHAIKVEYDQRIDPHTEFSIQACPADECCPDKGVKITASANFMLAGDSIDLNVDDGNIYWWGWEQSWEGGGCTSVNGVSGTTYYAASASQLPPGCSNIVTIKIYPTRKSRDHKNGDCAQFKILIQKIVFGKAGNKMVPTGGCGYDSPWCQGWTYQTATILCDGTEASGFPYGCLSAAGIASLSISACNAQCSGLQAANQRYFNSLHENAQFCAEDVRTPEMIAAGCCPAQFYLDMLDFG